MTDRENYLRTVHFDHPDYIPISFWINPACWNAYPQDALCKAIEAHPLLFPNGAPELPYIPEYGTNARKDVPYIDDFGCTWRTTDDGITGTVVDHPLSDWDDFIRYSAPDPEKCMGIGEIDWEETARETRTQKENGELTIGGLRHGHTFLQLCDIRGYENLLYDMEDEEPRLYDLIELVEHFNAAIVDKYIRMNVDVMTYAEDLGMQRGPMLSPKNFRKYIAPVYRRLMDPAKRNGMLIHMHSDGDIKLLAADIIENGADIINLQDLVNGVDWIAENFKGKSCIELDIDRQQITRFGSPEQIDALIREEVQKLGDLAGGLMLIYGLYPDVPLENVWAVMDAMECYAPLH